MMDDPLPPQVRRVVKAGGRTCATLGRDGVLLVLAGGAGLAVGPLAPSQLRALAYEALASADALEEQAEAAGQIALQELAGICG